MPAMDQPLTGIHILDLTRLLPGPTATVYLADMAAVLIKIDAVYGGVYARTKGHVEVAASQFPLAINRGRQCRALDLANGTDRDRFLARTGATYVLIISFRPGTMARLKIGWVALKARRSCAWIK